MQRPRGGRAHAKDRPAPSGFLLPPDTTGPAEAGASTDSGQSSHTAASEPPVADPSDEPLDLFAPEQAGSPVERLTAARQSGRADQPSRQEDATPSTSSYKPPYERGFWLRADSRPSPDLVASSDESVERRPSAGRFRSGWAVAAVAGVLVGFFMRGTLPPGGLFAGSAALTRASTHGELDLRALNLSPSGARVFLAVTGSEAGEDSILTLPKGEHEFEFRADGHETRRLTVQVTPGEVTSFPQPVVLSSSVGVGVGVGTGYLDLSGARLTPANARILVGGNAVSPTATLALPAGTHALSFTRSGFLADEREIIIEAGETFAFAESVVLARAVQSGTLIVSADLPLEVFDGDTLLGSVPFTGRLRAGSHRLRFTSEQLSFEGVFQVTPSQPTEVDLRVVSVNSRPFGDVAVLQDDGTLTTVGATPGRILVPAGSVLVFTHPEFESRQVRLQPNQATVSVSLTSNETPDQ